MNPKTGKMPRGIIWTAQAQSALNEIFLFYKTKSLKGAQTVKKELLHAPKSIVYSKQFQIDNTNPNYRRIVIRDFKILYKEVDTMIYILDIISTRMSPDILKKK